MFLLRTDFKSSLYRRLTPQMRIFLNLCLGVTTAPLSTDASARLCLKISSSTSSFYPRTRCGSTIGCERRAFAIWLCRGGLPLTFIGFGSSLGISDWLRLRVAELRLWVGDNYRWLMRYREVMRAPTPRWWLRAGRQGDPFANPLYPRLNCVEVLPMLHFDAETAQSAAEYCAAPRPYAVFLDQVMIDHPELELLKKDSEVDPERYHPALARCFLAVEEQTGLDVIVARHPKATPQPRLGSDIELWTCP